MVFDYSLPLYSVRGDYMTPEEQQQLDALHRNVEQLIRQYRELKAQCQAREEEFEALRCALHKAEGSLSIEQQRSRQLLMSRVLIASQSDSTSAKKRLAEMIDKMNSCIALLELQA